MTAPRVIFDRLIAWSPVLLLGGLAALTYWLDAQVQPPAPRRDGSTRHDPDLFLVNFRAVTFDAQGKPRESVAATRGDHFPDDETTELTQPRIRITQVDKPAFEVVADRARISGDREHAYFSGHVVANRAAEEAASAKAREGTGALTLTTEYLHVIPKQDRAETDRAVTIREPRGIIEGVGLELDNKTKTLKIKSKVTGSFEPRNVPSQ
ncbi:MAG: LPS export ABC transporter periplasmic protein LptC [Betaproteobacteria bacterium]